MMKAQAAMECIESKCIALLIWSEVILWKSEKIGDACIAWFLRAMRTISFETKRDAPDLESYSSVLAQRQGCTDKEEDKMTIIKHEMLEAMWPNTVCLSIEIKILFKVFMVRLKCIGILTCTGSCAASSSCCPGIVRMDPRCGISCLASHTFYQSFFPEDRSLVA